MGYVLKLSTDTTLTPVEFDKKRTLGILQDCVGGMIERITLAPGCDMWVNEEYLIVDPRPPVNSMATLLLWFLHEGHRRVGTVILGDVVFTGCRGEHTTPVPLPLVLDLYEWKAMEIPKEFVK